MKNLYHIIILSLFSYLFSGQVIDENNASYEPWSQYGNSGGYLGRLGEYGYPTNPMNDRAIGYLLKGKAKSAVTNYGEFIEWDVHPAGLWGDYTYLPDVCFITGIPGQSYSYKYEWFTFEDDSSCPVSSNEDFIFWCSYDAYNNSKL